MQIPPFSLSRQLSEIGSDLDTAVSRVLQSGQYIGGSEVEAFEESFAAAVGTAYVVSCNSGTDALVLALRSLDIGVGDEVITASFSFFATAEAISIVGAKPVFVEVDPKTYLLDINQIENAITKSSKAILPVHLFGCPVNMSRLMSLAKEHDLKVIEDCAQATGSEWEGRPLGGWGDIGCFSFFPTKNLGAAGDAGAVSTHDACLAKRMRELAVHGMPKRYMHSELGYNSRMDAIQAAILNVKLPKLADWIKKRQAIANRYQTLLNGLPGIQLPQIPNQDQMVHSWNQFVIKVIEKDSINLNDEIHQQHNILNSRDWLKHYLERQGINTIIYYPIPIHLQPAYKHIKDGFPKLPITERICGEVLSLPIYPELSFEQQDYIISTIKNLLDKVKEPDISYRKENI